MRINTNQPEVIVTARAWNGASRDFKRAVVARAYGTQNSAFIDAGVQKFDRELVVSNGTGATGGLDLRGAAEVVGGLVITVLAFMGGIAVGMSFAESDSRPAPRARGNPAPRRSKRDREREAAYQFDAEQKAKAWTEVRGFADRADALSRKASRMESSLGRSPTDEDRRAVREAFHEAQEAHEVASTKFGNMLGKGTPDHQAHKYAAKVEQIRRLRNGNADQREHAAKLAADPIMRAYMKDA